MTVRGVVRITRATKVGQQIEQAKHEIQRWAEFEREGEPLVFYVDKNISAAKKRFSERPESGKAWKESVTGDTIVTNKLDRAFRNTMDCLDTANECDKHGIHLAISTLKIDTSTAAGRLVLTMLAALAQFEAEQVAERTKAAIQTFRREGRHWGDKPFGFHSVDNPNGKGLVLRPIVSEGLCDTCRVKEQDPESKRWYDTEEPLTHHNEGGRLRDAMLEYARTDTTQAKLAESLGLPEASFRKLLSNERLYGKTPGGQIDGEQALISKAEYMAIQQRLGGPREWTRSDSFARAFKCYHCKRHLYYDKHGDFYRCEAPKSKHKGFIRSTVTRKVADEFAEKEFTERFGSQPLMEIVPADDSERQERIAEIELELADVRAQIGTPGTDNQALFERVQELTWEREEAETWEAPTTTEYRETPYSVAQYFGGSDVKAQAALLRQCLSITVYPTRGEHKRKPRFEVEPLQEPSNPIGFTWSLEGDDTTEVLDG